MKINHITNSSLTIKEFIIIPYNKTEQSEFESILSAGIITISFYRYTECSVRMNSSDFYRHDDNELYSPILTCILHQHSIVITGDSADI